MLYSLVNENDPILHKVAEPWDFNNPILDINELFDEMIRIMQESKGIGLAAPQIGISTRVFIFGVEPYMVTICINPKILSVEDQVKDVEGCLSFPGLYLPIVRYNKIVVEFYGLNGDKIQRDYSGLLAVAFQHEVDHLDGITFDSKVSKLVLDVNLRKRKKRS